MHQVEHHLLVPETTHDLRVSEDLLQLKQVNFLFHFLIMNDVMTCACLNGIKMVDPLEELVPKNLIYLIPRNQIGHLHGRLLVLTLPLVFEALVSAQPED